MYRAIERILLSEDQIRARIQELGQQLTADYREKNPIFVGILKGVVVFFADMIRAIPLTARSTLWLCPPTEGAPSPLVRSR